MNIEITNQHRAVDHELIDWRIYEKRRLQRRRRVAKRLTKTNPIFVVEEMKKEFPDYDWEKYTEDITRKTRKYKSIRHPKQWAFDWKLIYQEIPEFFQKCVERTKTRAVVRMRFKSGDTYRVVINAKYTEGRDSPWGGADVRLLTTTLIELWRGPVKKFITHPAVDVYPEK